MSKWIADLHALGYANATITSIVKLLSMILTDAADGAGATSQTTLSRVEPPPSRLYSDPVR